jgi:hypothetical protein
MMRRELAAWLLVLLVLALVFGFVWLSWRPEDPVFDRIAGWPVVGGAVERVRQIYLPPDAADRVADRPAAGAGSRGAAPGGVEPAEPGQPEWVFLGVGAALRAEPDIEAPLVSKTRRLDHYRVLERAEPWIHVALPDGREAWVDLDAPRDRTPPLGSEPTPPGPLPARPAAPEVLSLADSLLIGERVERVLGGYRVRSDVLDASLLERLGERLAGLESVYAERYGVRPVGRPAETIVVFALEAAYRRFESRVPELRGVGSAGHAADGVAALFVGDRPEREVLATAIHEVTHLLNRRALGPALPPWIEEGLADEMALLGLARASGDGSPYAGSLSFAGSMVRGSGPLAGLVLLLDRVDAGELSPLESLPGQDWQDFREAPRGRDLYNQSGFFVHYLLEREGRSELRDGLRSFLAGIARGESATGERLIAQLGTTWAELEGDFRSWLALEGEAVGAGLLRARKPRPDAGTGPS